jgi:hypothetical protein
MRLGDDWLGLAARCQVINTPVCLCYLETELKQKNKRKHYDKTGERVIT